MFTAAAFCRHVYTPENLALLSRRLLLPHVVAACCPLTLPQSSHWSCCGVLQREAPCKLVGAAAEVLPISDDVTSADIDSIMQARPQISFYCFVRLLRVQLTP